MGTISHVRNHAQIRKNNRGFLTSPPSKAKVSSQGWPKKEKSVWVEAGAQNVDRNENKKYADKGGTEGILTSLKSGRTDKN